MGIFDGTKIVMNIQENIEQAKKLIEQTKLDDALIILQNSLKNTESSFIVNIKFEIGKIYYMKGEYENAEKEFLQIKDDEGYSCFVYDFLIKIYYLQKKYKEVVKLSYTLDHIKFLDLIRYIVYSHVKLKQEKNIKTLIQNIENKDIKNRIHEEIKEVYRIIINEYREEKKYNKCIEFIESIKEANIKDELKNEIKEIYRNIINEFKEEKRYKECFFVLEKLNEKNVYYNVLDSLIKYITELNLNNEKEKIKKIYSDVYKIIPDIFLREKNIFLNEYEISQGKTELKSYPIGFQITLTRKCNLRCVMCGVPYDNLNYSLSDKEIDEIIEIMPYLNDLTLQGGEVFFDNRISRILETSKKNNVCTKIITNGLLLKRDIIKTLVTMNVDLIISIDSCDKQNYEQIRIGAKFENLIENINLLNKMRKENDSKMNLTLAMVVMKRNYKEIENIIRFAKEHKFSAVTLSQIYGNLPGNEQNFFDFDVDYNIIKELDDKRIYFNNLAKQCSIVLQNKLPRFSDYNVNNNPEIKTSDIPDIKKNMDVNLSQKLENNIEKNNKEEKTENEKELININAENESYNDVMKTNIHPLFCYRPFKHFFIDDCNFYPHCICAHTDNLIKDCRNDEFKNSKNNSILERWNSKYMQTYREKMFCKKEIDVCTSRCLRNREINNI